MHAHLVVAERHRVGWAESSRPTNARSNESVGLEDSAHPTCPPLRDHAQSFRKAYSLAKNVVAGWCLMLTLGCGTTRMTDTARTATEQLLISNAVDQAVSQIDFRPLAGKTVFCDSQYLDGTVDRGYVISSVRQQLLAIGATIHDERNKAEYVVEVRSGAIGTDRHSLLVGVPQMTVPAIVPGQPSQIPEIPVAKKTDEQGVAKIALFAYNRHTGQRLWQSGTVQSVSDARDFWIAGLGPFRAGTIVHG